VSVEAIRPLNYFKPAGFGDCWQEKKSALDCEYSKPLKERIKRGRGGARGNSRGGRGNERVLENVRPQICLEFHHRWLSPKGE